MNLTNLHESFLFNLYSKLGLLFKPREGISVVIPCHNYAEYLVECVGSVVKQTFYRKEIIIINDASDDDTKEVALDIIKNNPKNRIKVFNLEKNLGPSEARNIGIRNSSYPFVFTLDADDRLHEKALELLLGNLLFHKADLVYPGMKNFGNYSSCNMRRFDKGKQIFRNQAHNGMLFRKKCLNDAGMYRNVFKHGFEDWDFVLNFLENNFKIVHVPLYLYHYRQKESGRLSKMYGKKAFEMTKNIISNHPRLYKSFSKKEMMNNFKELASIYGFGDSISELALLK